MPKRIYRELSGRKDKVILEQAAQYGIPIGGPEVDLGAVLRWLHDSIAAGKFKPLGGAGGESFDWMPDAQKSRLGEEQIRKTRAQADILELEREEKEKTLIPREAVFGLHSQIAGVFRTFADRLQKTFGLEARKMFLETIDAAERKINGLLADPGEPAADNSPDQHGSIGADNSNATHPAEVSGGDSV
jgi:phage terminase Nu1 subunit (DNA packaging protein)